jgi:antitoxin component of MazEF toxin-antitoxin module
MAIRIKSTSEDAISLPAHLLAGLKLREGDEVTVTVEGQTLRLARVDLFLSLRGALASDDDFDRAMEFIDRAWQAWTTPASA